MVQRISAHIRTLAGRRALPLLEQIKAATTKMHVEYAGPTARGTKHLDASPSSAPTISVLLVMPPQNGLLGGFANGLLSLASHLSNELPGLQIDILDLSGSSREETVRALEAYGRQTQGRFVILGITTTTASYQKALATATAAKASLPHCFVVFGGPHASADPQTVVSRHPQIVDAVVTGEGERALVSLVEHFPDLTETPGLAFLDACGQYRRNAAPAPLTESDLDRLDIFWRGGLVGQSGKFDATTYVSARGCPLKCAFCSVSNSRIRAKSVRQVRADVRRLVAAGYRRISVEDNFFAHAPQRTRDVCSAFKALREDEGHVFTWDCQTRVESLANTDTVSILEDAGCVAVYVGVESLIPERLRYLNKTRNPPQYLALLGDKVIPRLLDSDVSCYLNLQLGIPGEEEADHTETQDLLFEWGGLAAAKGKTITIFPQLHVVYPGTSHFEEGIRRGRFPADIFERFTEWEEVQKPVLNWLGEHFAHGTGGLPEGILASSELSRGEFQILPDEIFDITTCLSKMGHIEGISVFRYGAYLAGAPTHSHALTH